MRQGQECCAAMETPDFMIMFCFLVVQVASSRCGKDGSLTVSSDAIGSAPEPAPSAAGAAGRSAPAVAAGPRPFEAAGECVGCHTPWHAAARPRFVHGGANVLCALKLRGCVPRDILPCLLAVQCASCSGIMTMRGVQVRDGYMVHCMQTCFYTMQAVLPCLLVVQRASCSGIITMVWDVGR